MPPTETRKARAVGVAREAAVAFVNADKNGDGILTFDEFMSALPEDTRRLNSKKALREVFDLADIDGNGEVTMDEYFVWTLGVADSVGSGLEAIFRKYDKSGEGTLDSSEFQLAIEDMGFGGFGQTLFCELDRDGSGTISFSELKKMLKTRTTSEVSNNSKRFLMSMAFEGSQVELDLRMEEWDLQSLDADSLREEIQLKLLARSGRASDLFKVFVTSDGRKNFQKESSGTRLTKELFIRILTYTAGFKGTPDVLREVFNEMDDDRSGMIGIAELHGWLNNNSGRAKAARDLKLRNRGSGVAPLDEIEWSPKELQKQMQLMLFKANLGPLDLIRAFDDRGSGEGNLEFSRREFLAMHKMIIDDLELWDSGIRDAVSEAFTIVSGGDRSVDATEFGKWLNKNWQNRLKDFQSKQDYQNEKDSKWFTSEGHELGTKLISDAMKKPSQNPIIAVRGYRRTREYLSATAVMSFDSIFRPKPLLRSDSSGLCSSSCSSVPSSPVVAAGVASWMLPVPDAGPLRPQTPSYRATQPRRSTSSHLLTGERVLSQSSSQFFSRPSSQLLPRQNSAASYYSHRAQTPFVPLTRPIVRYDAMQNAASSEAAMVEAVAAELEAKTKRRAAAWRKTTAKRRQASLHRHPMAVASRSSIAPAATPPPRTRALSTP